VKQEICDAGMPEATDILGVADALPSGICVAKILCISGMLGVAARLLSEFCGTIGLGVSRFRP